MKVLLIILPLVFVADAVVIKSVNSTRSYFGIGNVEPYDILLKRIYLNQPAPPNEVQNQDYVYEGFSENKITAVYVIEIGPTQNATASFISGGLGYSDVTVRLQSAKGYGYNFQISIWSRY